MKKLSFVLCFAFMAGVVFAQNSSTVTQTGLINNASIVQAGSSTAILSQETLSGARNNNATISQTGAGNTVSSGQVQGAGIASAQNLSATQSGIGNVALQTQASSYIGYNNATIEQCKYWFSDSEWL